MVSAGSFAVRRCAVVGGGEDSESALAVVAAAGHAAGTGSGCRP